MSALSDDIRARQGSSCLCCEHQWVDRAHIWPSGMGGRPSMLKAGNLVGLCRRCHDIFDGRDLQGRQRMMRRLMESRRDLVELQGMSWQQ